MIFVLKNSTHMIQEKGLLDRNITVREILFVAVVALCASPLITAPLALVAGIVVAWTIGNPYLHLNHKITHLLLQISVVGLGFGMTVNNAVNAGKSAFSLTIATITGALLLGFLVNRFLIKSDKKTAWLIAVGTAICGGSAIAAISPAIKAHEKQITVAVGTIFILNAIALLVFPFIGFAFHLSQEQFGLWSAIAIHDTSSVTGAAARYGKQALEIATTVKLARALWIVPVTLLSSFLFKTKDSRVKIPWFILLFILAIIVNTYVPIVHEYGHLVVALARSGLCVTLFLIGTGLSKSTLQSVGFKPLMLGAVLWICISVITLWVIIK
jgi:uncharacterized integral membrane protein (TIGR00698 family)